MGTLNLRLDAGLERFLERAASRSNRSRSDIAREALIRYRAHLEEGGTLDERTRPIDLVMHLIGAFPQEVTDLSVESGAKFKAALQKKTSSGNA